MARVSLLSLTLNRPEIAKPIIQKNLEMAGYDDYELLICDQGSTDQSYIQWLQDLNPFHFRKNVYNEGISRALNQLIIRSSGEYFFLFTDDILLSPNWLKTVVEYADDIPMSGIIGFEGQDLKHPQEKVIGKSGIERIICREPKQSKLEGSQVFGSCLISKDVITAIGVFHEGYHPYGLEDSDFCFRTKLVGYLVYYIPGLMSKHMDEKPPETSPHGIYKNFSYFSNLGYHRWRATHYGQIGLYEPFPVPKNPMF
jgi:GT2 family glycosyltransferase